MDTDVELDDPAEVAELLTRELIAAGFGKHMDSGALAECIGNLMLDAYSRSVREAIEVPVRTAVEKVLGVL